MKPELQLSLGANPVRNYSEAVEAYGGVPLAAYLPEPVPERCAGLILTGGEDVVPELYGEENTACFGVDRARDEAEFRLIEAYLAAGKPILGICRGHQVLNVFFGGSLCQHIPTAETHMPTREGDRVHETRAVPGSFPAVLYGERFWVNSAHHQGLARLAPELEAVQRTEDGVIEACRHTRYPVYSVQWHPERMCLSRARADTVDGGRIFKWFIELAAGR